MMNGRESAAEPHPGNLSPPLVVIHAKGIHYIPLLKIQKLHGNRYKMVIRNNNFLISSKTRDCPILYGEIKFIYGTGRHSIT
jgi:hypothetical protein